jgi:hypothetical protein
LLHSQPLAGSAEQPGGVFGALTGVHDHAGCLAPEQVPQRSGVTVAAVSAAQVVLAPGMAALRR